MSDLNWCTFCDNAISPFSKSLYCSDHCLRADSLTNHPLLGYTYPDCIHFARRNTDIYHLPPKSVTVSRQISSLSTNNKQQPSSKYFVSSLRPSMNAIDKNHLHLSNKSKYCQQTQTTSNSSKIFVRLYAN